MTGVSQRWKMPLSCAALVAVLYCESGTVTDTVGFDDYRVSAGLGIRLYIPQLGPIPISFDFGFPILAQDGDEEQLISFGAQLPFN